MESNQISELESLKQSGTVSNSPFFSSLSKATSGPTIIKKSNTRNKNPFLDQNATKIAPIYTLNNSKTSPIDVKNSSFFQNRAALSRQTFLQPILPENLWFISNAVLDNLKSRTHGKENELAVLKDDEEDLGSQVTLTELEEPVTASQEIHTQMIASHDPDYFGNDVTSVVVGCDCTAADEALDVFRKENTETEGRAPLEEDAMTTSLLQLYTGENPAMSLKCPLRESPVQPATFMNLPVMNSESLESDHYFGSFDFDSFDQSPFQNSDTRALSTSVNSNETNLSAPAENGITERQGEAELTKTVKSDLSSISERNLDLEFCLPLPDAFLCSFLDETKSDTEAMEKDSNPISSQFLDLRRTSSGESLSGIINGWESKLSASEYVEGGHTSSTSHFNDPNCFSGTEEPEALNRLTCLPLDLPSFGTDWKAEDMMPKCIAFPLASYDIKLSPKPKAPAAKPVFKKISSVFMDANTSQIEQQNKVFSSEKNFEELPMSLFDQRKGPSVHVLKTARISSVPFEHLGPSSSETVMEKSVCDHLNRPSDVDAKSVTKITHKKVSFGSAWKGELETVRYIQDRCHSPIINPDADGLIILQFNDLTELKMDAHRDRSLQLEVTHMGQTSISPQVFLPSGQDKLHIGYETKMLIDASGELIIKLISNKEESTVIESFSKLFGTISKKNGKKLRPSLPGQNPESREDGADSKIKGQIRLEMAHLTMNPCKIQEMALSIGYKKRPLCLVSLKCIYVPAYGKRGDVVLPRSFLEVEEALNYNELHKRISKKGYMYQRGGDMETWKKRYFKLQGMALIVSQGKNSPVLNKFDLTQLWTAQILTHPASAEYKQKTLLLDIMELEFKDGVVIQFGTESADSEGGSLIDDWMTSLEEVDVRLGTNPIPEWLSS